MTEDYKTPVGAAPPDWRGLCEELVEFVARLTKHYYEPAELLIRARAALAQPEPEGRPAPTPAGERRAAPVPVAVSDRLPQPEDCDAEGRVWGTAELGGWRLVHHSKIGLWREWLPAHALPLPNGEAQP